VDADLVVPVAGFGVPAAVGGYAMEWGIPSAWAIRIIILAARSLNLLSHPAIWR